MSVALFHRGARVVLVLRRAGPGQETWWSPYWRLHDWRSILETRLVLLGLLPRHEGPCRLACGLGRIEWTPWRHWATFSVRLDQGPVEKRRLVTLALIQAARYARPDRGGR